VDRELATAHIASCRADLSEGRTRGIRRDFGAKAAATKALTGSGLLAVAKAAATKRSKLAAAQERLTSSPSLPMLAINSGRKLYH
jgi:hypothetical protein